MQLENVMDNSDRKVYCLAPLTVPVLLISEL